MWREPFQAGDVFIVVAALFRVLKNAKRREPAVARKQRTSKGLCGAKGKKVLIDENAAVFAFWNDTVRGSDSPGCQRREGARHRINLRIPP
jgi:ribosomal protein L14